jgi:tRNA (guanine-N7-)-methyltransferase
VGKKKLKRWVEMEAFEHVIQPQFEETYKKDYHLKGKWATEFFKNNNPIFLELGCGKGEYTIELARKNPQKNFIGVDIKGARMWRGAQDAWEEQLKNVAFLRTRIELINSFFGPEEVSEIWLAFPDPQLKKRRNKKRLTSARFLNSYNKFLKPGGIIHLKTDDAVLYHYTFNLIRQNQLEIVRSSEDLYKENELNYTLSIKTHYEKQFLSQGLKIYYLCFKPATKNQIKEPEQNE